jgi:hypothetical protein
MRKLALPLLVLVLASLASAQTTTANILPNQGCVHITNCQVMLDNNTHLWVQNDPSYPNHFVGIWENSTGAQVAYCLNDISVYQNTPLPNGSVNLHVECESITVDENWIGYHTRVGTRYLVNGGKVSY